MAASQLKEAFLHLSQHSVDSVQNGKAFTNWDEYMHVDRPIESKLMENMDEITTWITENKRIRPTQTPSFQLFHPQKRGNVLVECR